MTRSTHRSGSKSTRSKSRSKKSSISKYKRKRPKNGKLPKMGEEETTKFRDLDSIFDKGKDGN